VGLLPAAPVLPSSWICFGGYDEQIDKGRGSRGRRRARHADPERSGSGGAGRLRRARRAGGGGCEEHMRRSTVRNRCGIG